uniref:Mediator of RNA polymerase II transcription subunit 25 n=1 Tax=Glycine max TaxID=3847 RepID=A0A368UM32_SOYBN|eukprot:XP_014629641.1 mediator of RNA polymerase II transcription subunit 25 isoform X1 [Glycine max]
MLAGVALNTALPSGHPPLHSSHAQKLIRKKQNSVRFFLNSFHFAVMRRDGGKTAYRRCGKHRRHGTLLGDHSEGLSRQDYQNSSSSVEFALVSYNTHGCYSDCLVQRTGWTRDPDVFFLWLSSIPFSGGGFNDAVIAEGLAEALMMFPNSQSGDPNQQNVEIHQHCILVAASNPYPLRTPICVPQLQNLEQSETIESFPGNCLYDAEAVAKAFPQFSISLSVICPKQLPKIKAIYNAGKRNSKAADPPVLAKTPHFLILISEGFREAQGVLKVGEGNSSVSESEKFAAKWPAVMQIVQLISQAT